MQGRGPERGAHGRFVRNARGARRSAARPHAGRDGAVASLESQLAAAQSTSQEQELARRSVEEQLVELQTEVKQLRKGEVVQRDEQLARAVHDKDKQLAGMRMQLERARKEATLENTRRHLALVKRKHEEVSEALEIAAVHCLPARQASECVLKVPRTFSQWRSSAWNTNCWAWNAVEHQHEGRIVTAAVPIGMAVGNRIWDLRWSSGYAPDYAQHPPPRHVQGIVDSAGAYMGVKQTTGVTKVVRHDGRQNNSLVGNNHVLLYEGDDAYEVLAEKGKRFFDELNDIATKGVTLPNGTKPQAEGAEWRELIWRIKASHSFVKGIVDKAYKCPCCNKMIRKHGDVPPKKTKNGLREFARLHAAQRYLKPPMLHVGAKRKIPDLLHINLRITAGLYYYTVQRHCATPEDLQALRQWMFDELGITVNSKKRQNKKQDAVSIGQKKESFIGAECVKLIAQYDK
eukprot:jgi/Tetstr1/429107/TSEL_019069.t1